MAALDICINRLITDKVLKNAAIRAGIGDEVLIDSYFSHTHSGLCDRTLFDMASVSKIIATTSLTHIAVSKGLISFGDKVEKYFDVSEDKKELTIKHLLTHTMGFGHKNLCGDGVNYDNIAEHILFIPNDVPTGSETIYSCPGFILLGKILEKVYGERLDALLVKYVTTPLGMSDTCYLPSESLDFAPCNFRGQKFRVNDYNCDFLGGIAGNAGVFSNIADMTKFAKMLLSYGSPIIDREVFLEAIKNHTSGLSESRTLGYVYVDGKYRQTGRLFPKGSFGHCGHTGQSVFVHPTSGLYVIILSDMTATLYNRDNGKYEYNEVCAAREKIHNAIMEDVKK